MEVVYYVAASVDGFIATADGGVDWLSPFQGPDEDYGYGRFIAGIDVLLMGSRTYEQVLGFGAWPYEQPSVVFSSRLPASDVAGVEVTARAIGPVLEELAAGGHRRAWLVGGTALATSFRRLGRIDRYELFLMPRLLGRGVPLFEAIATSEDLLLEASKSYSNGVQHLRYGRRQSQSGTFSEKIP
ncbi:MAG: dihydrofolate reductase family protein [Acidobacteriota bacterium]